MIKKRKLKKPKSKNEFKALEIHEIDERDRCTSLAQRDYLLKTCGLLQTVSILKVIYELTSLNLNSSQIYVNFHRSQLLTESDKRKYKDMFSKLTADNEIKSLPILSSVQSKPALKTTQIVLETPTITLNETKTALTSASTNSAGRNQNWVHCSELQLTTRSIAQLPLLNQNSRWVFATSPF